MSISSVEELEEKSFHTIKSFWNVWDCIVRVAQEIGFHTIKSFWNES